MNGEKDGTIFNPNTFGLGAVSSNLPGFPDPVLFTFNENKRRRPKKSQKAQNKKGVKK
jgi:hypothetical protein